MNTMISAVLISAPLAFLAGWVVSKAVFMSMRGVSPARKKSAAREQVTGADDRDAQIAELQQQLDRAEARIRKSESRFKSWRERTRPVARQFRQQRKIINELRDELRRRDTAARQAEETRIRAGSESSGAAVTEKSSTSKEADVV